MEVKRNIDTSKAEKELNHTHKLVFLGKLEGEFGGSKPLYQCNECGATFEIFSGGKYAVFYPEWTKNIATSGKESIDFVKKSSKFKGPTNKVLGRSLKDIQNSQNDPGRGLRSLMGLEEPNEQD